jgi:hypothetical protein
MKQIIRIALVFVIISTLVAAESNVLFAQSQVAAPSRSGATFAETLAAAMAETRTPLSPPAATAALPAARPPQASSRSKNIGLVTGLAMIGVGSVMAFRKEPVHQTTCIPYDACPPGAVKTTGAIMIGVGVPLTILKLKGH